MGDDYLFELHVFTLIGLALVPLCHSESCQAILLGVLSDRYLVYSIAIAFSVADLTLA
ncbi:hypothetical protein PN499_13495 [Kamptonema animale CS-326]|uniref:hypothetical protein n=1 Tax=Kamptonema animale TaxID=92934 RepID=UPI00232EC3B2|nr:hypothetical protein [Kamptonema animale]MDB9512202.1 hypothetical protein [Kamptonema animale CS-326]